MQRQLTHVTVRNGLTLAYVVALINSALAVLIAFGVTITNEQEAAMVGFVNAAVLVGVRVLHLPEKTGDGGIVSVSHVPVLTSQGPVQTSTGLGGETVVTPLPFPQPETGPET